MKQYLDLIKYIHEKGVIKDDRTGTGTKSIFGYQMRFDLNNGFPLMTTKKVNLNAIIHELLWFIKGDTNIRYLVLNNVNIWNDWPFKNWLKIQNLEDKFPMFSQERDSKMKEFIEKIKSEEEFSREFGELGPVYGKQWRDFEGVDQLTQVIDDIKKNPDSRRHIVSAWNPKDIPVMVKSGLPPCHSLFQFYVAENELSCQLYQRSADVFLGVPYNIASYSLLNMMIAQVCSLKLGHFIHSFGDAHLYLNHLKQAEEQIEREPYPLPKLKLSPNIHDIHDFKIDHFELIDYQSHSAISAPIAV
tara:strand:+ start:63559 stop:64464 length:906 start_codon:yes stop_codon:yes gene_type:complete